MTLTETAETVLKRRYYLKDTDGNPIETWPDLCRRVANHVASVEKEEDRQEWAQKFFDIIHDLDFLPNSPCLMNAGTDMGQLSACFVLPVEDSMESIFTAVKHGALVHKTGGGTGYSFSSLRAKNSAVQSTQGVASGPLSFMQVFDTATETIKQGGKRRGANMAVLSCDHPDILEFIDAKEDTTKFNNFNFSVAITDEFMRRAGVEGTREHDVMERIIDRAWRTGEPGVLFIDTANKANTIPHVGKLGATNPCWTGDTQVWTSEGPITFRELADKGEDVLVLSQDDEGMLIYKMMRNPRMTESSSDLVEITFDNFSKVRCTPSHNVYLRNGRKVAAKDLKPGDCVSSVYRYSANQKGYKRITNGIEQPLEHHVNAQVKYGRRPNYPDEHCHHIDEDKENNHWGNLEILPASAHNSLNMLGENNPMYGVWDERNPLFGMDVSGVNNPRYRHDIDDDVIKAMRESGSSIAKIADTVGCSPYTVCKRLGWSRPEAINHKVVSVKVCDHKEPVFNGTVDDLHRYFVMCGKDDAILSANCGEQWLLPYESCNLGSINLSNFIKVGYVARTNSQDMGVDYARLEEVVRIAVRFLDNVIDCNKYPIPEIEKMTRNTRKIGLGIMGLHDMLIQLGHPYDSDAGRRVSAEVMKCIHNTAKSQSEVLAMYWGSTFPSYDPQACEYLPRRNAALTSIQPTGTVSMIADCASGCEPYFSIVMVKNVMDGDRLLMVNKHFECIARREGFYSDQLMEKVASSGTVLGHPEIPEKWQQVFKTAQDISPEAHVQMQAALQNNGVDSSISKTVNLPAKATREDVATVYNLGWELGCKGITVYRDGCRAGQVLNAGPEKKVTTAAPLPTVAEKEQLPDMLDAKRYRIRDTDGNAMYLIVCFDASERPMEVFAKFPFDNRIEQKDKATQWTTTCRMVSTALRYHIPMEEIIKQLERSSGSMFDLPAQLSKLLKSFMAGTQQGYSSPCPECSDGVVIFEEGCEVCKSCGYSKCS